MAGSEWHLTEDRSCELLTACIRMGGLDGDGLIVWADLTSKRGRT